MWLARDKNGELYLYIDEKPYASTYRNLGKTKDEWEPTTDNYCRVDERLFPEITFKNSPVEVELKLKINDVDSKRLG